MTYFIHPAWFYLINLVSALKGLGIILVFIGLIILFVYVVFHMICYMEDSDSKLEDIKKKFKKRLLLPLIIGTILITFVPSKDTCIEMTVASIVTKENVNYTVETVKEITDYVIEKVKGEK